MKKSTLEKSEIWRQHIKNWKQSGLSQKVYCKQENLNFHAFNYWNQKISNKRGSDFVAIQPIKTASSSEIRLELPNGLALSWSGEPDSDYIQSLVESLRS